MLIDLLESSKANGLCPMGKLPNLIHELLRADMLGTMHDFLFSFQGWFQIFLLVGFNPTADEK